MIRAWLNVLASLVMASSSVGCAMLGDYSPLTPLERSMVFQPLKYPAGNWEPKQLKYEDAWFPFCLNFRLCEGR